jgi:hypothetical protein
MQEAKNETRGDRKDSKDNTAVKEKKAKEEKKPKKEGRSLALDRLRNRVKLKQMLRSRTLIAGG